MQYFLEHTTLFLRRLRGRVLLWRFRDPLVQVWMLAGFSLLFSLFLRGPSAERGPAGQEGNAGEVNGAARLLLLQAGGPVVPWSDSFGKAEAAAGEARPALQLPPAPEGPPERTGRPAVFPEWREEMERAARLPWRSLKREVREAINAVPAGAFAPVTVSAVHSGAATGNGQLLSWRGGREGGGDFAFIIGNGSRSADGAIEPGPAWQAESGPPARLRVCFIGEDTVSLTPAQRAAAGELLNYLETRFGPVSLAEE